jgi:hypothetical protein
MRPSFATIATVGALSALAALAPAAASARAATTTPTRAQIRAAIRAAERSPKLWATVNVCDAPWFGIRGEIPALGFAANLSMTIQVDYWNAAKKRFVPLRGVSKTVSMGTLTSDLHQAGSSWRFKPPATLSGTVTFEWQLGHQVIGRTTRLTARGIKGVDDSRPRGTSAASCKLPEK